MQFFQQLAALQLVGNLKMTITPVGDKLTVTVLLDNPKCGDEARHAILPISVTGTAEELDAGFFQHVGQPMQAVSGLQVNMEAHKKALEKAKEQSAIGKAEKQGVAVAPPVDPKVVAYDKAMKEVEQLRDEKKFKDAIKKLPDVKTYPDKKVLIEQRRQWLMQQAMGGLFTDAWPVDDSTPEPEQAVVASPEPVTPTADAPADQDESDDDYTLADRAEYEAMTENQD